jgi:hypothetical protein
MPDESNRLEQKFKIFLAMSKLWCFGLRAITEKSLKEHFSRKKIEANSASSTLFSLIAFLHR